jgi:hypothetical protein
LANALNFRLYYNVSQLVHNASPKSQISDPPLPIATSTLNPLSTIHIFKRGFKFKDQRKRKRQGKTSSGFVLGLLCIGWNVGSRFAFSIVGRHKA